MRKVILATVAAIIVMCVPLAATVRAEDTTVIKKENSDGDRSTTVIKKHDEDRDRGAVIVSPPSDEKKVIIHKDND